MQTVLNITRNLTAGALLLAATTSASLGQTALSAEDDRAALELQVRQLQMQNQQLSKSLVKAKEQQTSAQAELNKLRLDLEALNMYPLGNDDQRLTQAVANRKVLEDRIARLESAAFNLTTDVRQLLQEALVDDETRLKMETSIRELDNVLGLIDKPRPQIDSGTMHSAKIIGIDGESGALILNAGEKQQVRMGMTFRILRGKSQIAEARVAGVRPEIAGALITQLADSNNAVRIGDTASIKTQPNQ